LKVIVVLLLGVAFVLIVLAMAIRAMVPSYEIESAVMGEIFDRFIGLFGVVVGYVLGSKKSGD
jgi:hypothetical protein